MKPRPSIRTSLARHLASTTTLEALAELRLRAWRQRGVVELVPDKIRDPRVRQTVINEATRLYGPRRDAER